MRCTTLIFYVFLCASGCTDPGSHIKPVQSPSSEAEWKLAGQFEVDEVVQDISILPDRRIEVTCQQQYLMFYDLESGEIVDKIDTGKTTVQTFLVPKSNLMLVFSIDSTTVININTKQNVLNIPNAGRSLVLNGDVLAVVVDDSEQFVLWDIRQRQQIRIFESIETMEDYYSSVLTPYDRYSAVFGVSDGYFQLDLFEAPLFRRLLVLRNQPALPASEIIWRADQETQSRMFGNGIEVHRLIGDDIMSDSTRVCFVECSGQYCSADCLDQDLVAIAFEEAKGTCVDIWSTAKNKMIAKLGPFAGQPHKLSWNETGELLAIITKTAHDSVSVSVFERELE